MKSGLFQRSETKLTLVENKNRSSQIKNNFWVKDRFIINTDVPTKNRLQIKKLEKRMVLSRRISSSEQLILENKDRLLVCMDTEGYFGQLKYCFVSKEIVFFFENKMVTF